MDYGNSEVTLTDGILTLPAKYLTFPRQGVLCQLSRIDYTKPMDSKYDDLFRSMCLNQTFTAQFTKNRDGRWLVELYHPTGTSKDLLKGLWVHPNL